MFPGLDPKKMQQVMKQMGIAQEDIPASKVIIEKKDNTRTIIENPSVTKVKMQGQETWQISGKEHEESGISEEQEEKIAEKDIKLIMEKTNCLEQDARKALENSNGDIAEAIIKLNQ